VDIYVCAEFGHNILPMFSKNWTRLLTVTGFMFSFIFNFMLMMVASWSFQILFYFPFILYDVYLSLLLCS